MKTFSQFLNETIDNFFIEDTKNREKYAQQVWDILQSSYKRIGGIHGNGFKSIEDMILNIPFWKIYRKGNEVKIVMMYKDSNGRKRVAVGTDGSVEAKDMLAKLTFADLNLGQSYTETSSNLLYFIIDNIGIDIIKHVIPIDKAIDKMKNDIIKTDDIYKKEFIKDFDRANDKGRFPKLTKDEILLIRNTLYKNCYAREIGNEYHSKVMLGNANSLPIKKY